LVFSRRRPFYWEKKAAVRIWFAYSDEATTCLAGAPNPKKEECPLIHSSSSLHPSTKVSDTIGQFIPVVNV
jgi:hypothetical protein